ncbi:MAG: MFS transporter [Alphaproteobacteria bacterium]
MAPFRSRPFLVLWFAALVSNTGSWMHDVGAGWLMTEMTGSPSMVAAVQSTMTLPVFLFGLLAGVLADLVDRRRVLLATNSGMAVVAAILAGLVWFDMVSPAILLGVTFLLGLGTAFSAPAWQSIVPTLVKKRDLPAAISLNSLSINISRAVGPALAGGLIVWAGLYLPFALNAISFMATVAALLWWSPPPRVSDGLPRESAGSAIKGGLRFVWNSPALKQTLVRAVAFFLFASAQWAMLPLVVKEHLGGEAGLYGVLLGCVGAGAVIAAVLMPPVRKKFGPNIVAAGACCGTAAGLVLFALGDQVWMAVIASLLAGAAWISVLTSLHVSAQTSLPDWVRARGLSVLLTVFFGCMSGGSLFWGLVAEYASIRQALLIASGGIVFGIIVSFRAKLGDGTDMDHTPSGHWRDPVLTLPPVDRNETPAVIQVLYRVDPDKREKFVELMFKLRASRRRSGGYGWVLVEAADEPNTFLESWQEASWTNHLRHHKRVSVDDQKIQSDILQCLTGHNPYRREVSHFVSIIEL